MTLYFYCLVRAQSVSNSDKLWPSYSNLTQLHGWSVCNTLTNSQIFTGAMAVITPLSYLIALIGAALADILLPDMFSLELDSG